MSHSSAKPATLAIHADNTVNNVTDVAPPIHLSTTYRYPNDPNVLTPAAEFKVWLNRECDECQILISDL